MTLTAISKKFGVSRERVRQIVNAYEVSKIVEDERKQRVIRQRKSPLKDATMGEVGSTRRVVNLIKRLDACELTPKEFIKQFSPRKVMALPGIGPDTMDALAEDMKEFDENAARLWSARKR